MSPPADSRNVRVAVRLGAAVRVALAVVSLVLAGLWLTAFRLTPERAGLGTHQQLGLPPCTARVLLGIRCPACGMTTSWAYLARGDVVGAAVSNVGGLMLGVLALVTIPAAAWMAAIGKRLPLPIVPLLAITLVLILTVTLIDWSARLAMQ